MTEGARLDETGGRGSTWCIVLAAGTGDRFAGHKQFERLNGSRLVDRAVEVGLQSCDGVVVVLPRGVPWTGPEVDAVAVGGVTQYESVGAGLSSVPDAADAIVVHDAAHPLVDSSLMGRVLQRLWGGDCEGVIPVLPVNETPMRVRDAVVVESIPRDGLFFAQAPLAFRAAALRGAHERHRISRDCATLVHVDGGRIRTVLGDPRNIHVTTPSELELVRHLDRDRERVRGDDSWSALES